MMHKNACTGCALEHSDKDNSLCLYCDRRIQYVKGQTVSAPFPSLEMIAKIKKKLRYKYDMSHTNLITASKDKVCKKCGGLVSRYSKHGFCNLCYNQSGDTCKMGRCEARLSPQNKSGFCRDCARIIYNRKKLGLPLYAPVKKRKTKKK